MGYVLCEIILSLFFVYGIYSAASQVKLLLKRAARRMSEIDKNKS